MKRITIGIVILNYKTYIDTEKLVCEILEQEASFDVVIQIVDNASPNESYSYLRDRFSGVTNVCVDANGKNDGFAKGNNYGLRLLKRFSPDYALILNNDVHFSLSVIENLLEVYNRIDDAGVLAPMQYTPQMVPMDIKTLVLPTFFDDLLAYTYIYPRLQRSWRFYENTPYRGVQRVGIIPGCFIFIDYALFERIGFFDEDTFLFCEERFISRKLKNIGKSNYMLLDCSFIHAHSKTISNEVGFLNRLRLLHDGRVAYTKRYRSFPLFKIMWLNVMWCYLSFRIRLGAAVRKFFRN